ncbi:very short patch repair endonuclease [Sphingomonas tabacisoli]|uniref:Very short patch repair endonuclease n=1 Tax=Sphingomonas tabacisoli TaxID=2249466 RepID=A0ABW4HZ58_9SPHN
MQNHDSIAGGLAHYGVSWATHPIQREHDLSIRVGEFHRLKAVRPPLSRSEVMARVKGRDTRPELRVRRALHLAGLRYRLQARELTGRPDIVFRRARIAIFVHGCFWHRHSGCEHARMPKSRPEFWEPKLSANKERDERNRKQLEAEGWIVITIWECETRDSAALQEFVNRIQKLVRSQALLYSR